MRPITRPACAAAPADGGGSSETELHTSRSVGVRPRGVRRGSAWRVRMELLLANGNAAPTPDDKRYAAQHLRRAFARIDRDFNEAYEQCRTDTQRRALEEVHRAARKTCLGDQGDALPEDRESWRQSEIEFCAERTRADRQLSGVKTATAVIRIRAKLAAIATHLAVLAA